MEGKESKAAKPATEVSRRNTPRGYSEVRGLATAGPPLYGFGSASSVATMACSWTTSSGAKSRAVANTMSARVPR